MRMFRASSSSPFGQTAEMMSASHSRSHMIHRTTTTGPTAKLRERTRANPAYSLSTLSHRITLSRLMAAAAT